MTTLSEPSPALAPATHWHALDAEAALAELATDAQQGLSRAEAARRLAQHGRNELQEKPRPGFLQLVLAQLNNFVVILLIVASIVSALLGDHRGVRAAACPAAPRCG